MSQQQDKTVSYNLLGVLPSTRPWKVRSRYNQLLAMFDSNACNSKALTDLSVTIGTTLMKAYDQVALDQQASANAAREARKGVFFNWLGKWAVVMIFAYFWTQPYLRAMKVQRDAEAAASSDYGLHQWYAPDIVGDFFSISLDL